MQVKTKHYKKCTKNFLETTQNVQNQASWNLSKPNHKGLKISKHGKSVKN
jgi:hypothetical protein